MNQRNEDHLKKSAEASLGDIERRLDVLDRRLDSIDSIVTVLGERVMKQPLTLEITCPTCGQTMEVNIVGSLRQRG